MTVTRLSQIGIGSRRYAGGTPFAGKEQLSALDAMWQSAKVLKRLQAGDELTTARLPPGNWKLLVKTQDTSKNYSLIPAITEVVVGNSEIVVYENDEAPRWPGAKSGFIHHCPSGKLVPDSSKAASDHSNAELFEQFVPYPVPQCHYYAPEFDIGFDGIQVRIWSQLGAELGPGKSGSSDPQLAVDYAVDGGDYDGYEAWEIGRVTARKFKWRATIYPADGVAMLTSMKPTVDASGRKEKFNNETIAPGGTVINFEFPFINPPVVTITPADAALIPWWDLKSSTAVRVHLSDAGGTDVGGDADITVEES